MKKILTFGNLVLVAIFFLAVFLRTYNLSQTLLFHFDQGYHGLAIRDLWENKHLVLLGHKTDVEGIFHSSLFYYLMLPLYLLSGWNPAGVSFSLAILDSLTVLIIYLMGRNLLNPQVGLIAALYYAVSYQMVSYARWLSNVTPVPFFASLYFYFLLRVWQKKLTFLIPASLFLGIVLQLNGAIGFFLTFPWLVVLAAWRKLLWHKKKLFLSSLAAFLLPSAPLVIFDIRHNFLVTQSIVKNFSTSGSGVEYGKVIGHLQLWLRELGNLLTYKQDWLLGLIGLFFITILMALWRQKKLTLLKIPALLFLPSLLVIILYPKGIHQFFYIGLAPITMIFFAWITLYWSVIKWGRLLALSLVILLVLINLNYWRGFWRPNFNLIPLGTRNLITLDDRLRATDFMYQRAAGLPFRTSIYIIPYAQEQPWDYVFKWYGQKQYGYTPLNNGQVNFVIYEPDYEYPFRLAGWLDRIEKDHGQVIAKIQLHDLTVEQRER